MKTNLEIFNEVEQHLLKQNAKSLARPDAKTCAYRGLQGMKCAVGCLIKDEHFLPEFNFVSVNSEHAKMMLEYSGIPIMNKGTLFMLDRLQGIHDAKPIKDWPHMITALREDLFNRGILPNTSKSAVIHPVF